jgi:Holliday junction resolvase
MSTGKTNRVRGATGEREWVAVLKEHGFSEAERNLGQSRDGGGDVCVPPFLWEVKRRRRISALRFLDQVEKAVAVSQSSGAQVVHGAVAMREDGNRQWYVMLKASDFFKLIDGGLQ